MIVADVLYYTLGCKNNNIERDKTKIITTSSTDKASDTAAHNNNTGKRVSNPLRSTVRAREKGKESRGRTLNLT